MIGLTSDENEGRNGRGYRKEVRGEGLHTLGLRGLKAKDEDEENGVFSLI